MAEKLEIDSKQQLMFEDLRLSVENYKRTLDAAQDDNYKLLKKVNILKDENDNKDTQIRRLNSKVEELKAEMEKVRNSRTKDKELIYHRKTEVLKLIKHVSVVLRAVGTVVIDEATAVGAVLDCLM
jgi:transcriptional regulator of heat shock response